MGKADRTCCRKTRRQHLGYQASLASSNTGRWGAAIVRRHKVHRLVWYKEFAGIDEAIKREKSMTEWRRAWKISLIERMPAQWPDRLPSLPGARLNAITASGRTLGPGQDKRRDDTVGRHS